MKITPLFDRVVLKEIKEEQQKTASGLVLPDNNNERPLLAEVICVSDGVLPDGQRTKIVVGKNDKVLFSKYTGSAFKLNGEEVIILRQSDILAKLDN